MNITSGLASNLSAYELKDYRRFLSAHLQFLTGICRLSMQSVNNTIKQFLSSLFITAKLLPEKTFNESIHRLIEQSKSKAPTTFTRVLFLIQRINHGNAIISNYGTNFEYIIPWPRNKVYGSYAPTRALIYDNCSCGLYSNCTTQASFIQTNSTEIIPIKGLKIGCTPSESFSASTLECFYDQSCIYLIEQYTNYTYGSNSTDSPRPLIANMSRLPTNTTISELINDLFIERWIPTINYTLYFEQCSPLLCSYTYIQQFNLLHTVTGLLGLEGGLTILLEWICPIIVRIINKVYQHRKKRTNIAQPISSAEITPADIVITDVHTSTGNVESIPASVTTQYAFLYIH